MMRSLTSGVAGLRSHQTRMDVIGNNIANVNTYGFKSSRVTFSDVYYQNVNGASAGVAQSQGGTNPTQIGYGASVATVDVLNAVSGSASTDRALDIYIGGDGFLICQDTNGNRSYTRLGNLGFDSAGNLVDGNGRMVQGAPMNADGTPRINADGTISDLTTIHCDPAILDRLTGISISNTGQIVGVLPGDKIFQPATTTGATFINNDTLSVPPDSNYTGAVKLLIGAIPAAGDLDTALGTSGFITGVDFGNMGLPANATCTFEYDGTNFTLNVGNAGDANGKYTGTLKSDGTVALKSTGASKIAMVLTVDASKAPNANPPLSGSITAAMVDLKYQVQVTDDGGNKVKMPQDPANVPPAGGSFTLDGMNISLAASTAAQPFVGTIGTIKSDDEIMYNIGNIAIAKFGNASGLKEAGSGYFAESANSGSATILRPGIDGTGEVAAGYLEMSNVDLSKEFTDMITTQRGFQANSRIITVSDTMLEELVNLKR